MRNLRLGYIGLEFLHLGKVVFPNAHRERSNALEISGLLFWKNLFYLNIEQLQNL